MKKQNLTIAERRENLVKEEAFLTALESFVDCLILNANYNFKVIKTSPETGECLMDETGTYIYEDYPYSDNEWEKTRYYKSVYAKKIIDFMLTLEMCDVE